MSVSTDANVCFGILLPEGVQLPWRMMSDLDDWWAGVTAWVKPRVYDARGLHLPGVTAQDIKEYWGSRRQHLADNPMPVEFVNCCSYDVPVYIAAVPSSRLHASRGYPLEFDCLPQPGEQETAALLEFCSKYLQLEGVAPRWYLSSFWGE
jgi:hypothetical protein